jgi:hypothetical protein
MTAIMGFLEACTEPVLRERCWTSVATSPNLTLGGSVSFLRRDSLTASRSHDGAMAGAAFHPRVERTRVELKRLRGEHVEWKRRRRNAVGAERYKTQLDAIDTLVECGVDQLEGGLDSVDLSLSEGAIYEACRTFDLRLLWLRRVWQFFREKFDQRDSELADTLRAADEIVWSCYHQVFERARKMALSQKAGSAPLPFIEPRYSPSTFPADLVPAGLQSEIDKPFLREHLNRLPVPVVRLQPGCVSGPWWLVYAAHEVGHNVQYDLLEGQALVDGYRELVKEAVRGSGGSAADVSRWGEWSREIFADIFSVLMMGPWAIWAMVELELQGNIAMSERREQYPSGAVRLALLAATATAVKLDARAALRGLNPQQIASSSGAGRRDITFTDAVVAASMKPLPAVPTTLARLCNFNVTDFQGGTGGKPPRVEALRRVLAADRDPIASAALDGPRLGAAASLAAWSDVMTTADEPRRSRLSKRSLRLITDSGPPGTRARDSVIDATDAVADVMNSLLAAERHELEA